ncbi:MAG: FAD-dependent oxidoreductase [Deltaproteobacteria bacterium]|nr:FAD-dependent oxidoreductase [Deltaproteobacteria bacterium]
MNVSVIGGGIFGITAALKMRARGHEVTIFEPGPIPHPLAESTDISKVVRMDYGADEDYTDLGERSLRGWRVWNSVWRKPLFHETGVTFLSRTSMRPGGFEHDSYATLTARGHELERLDADQIATRFPAYRRGALVDGYFNRAGGWAESGAVVEYLSRVASGAGIAIEQRAIHDLAEVRRDLTIVCAGAWVPRLVPELAGSIRAIGQPVFHLRPRDPALYTADRFPVFGADIANTGYYGFPVNADGIVKIANHGSGTPIERDEERVVSEAHEVALRAFLATTLPGLRDAPIAHRRLCVYADTLDGHFWIARHPTDESLVVATGGSGHAFKFAPVLGALIAGIILDGEHPLEDKFRWRPELGAQTRGDAARADR